MIGEEFYGTESPNSQTSGSNKATKSISDQKCFVTNSNTFVNAKKSLKITEHQTSAPTQANTEVVTVQKATNVTLSEETLARYQSKFGPIPTILTGKRINTNLKLLRF